MVLPEWAERAFEKHRPRGVGNDDPDPDRLAWWEGCKQRFEQRWDDLETTGWKVPNEHDCYTNLRRSIVLNPPYFVRLCILETVLDIAWDCSVGKTPDKIAPAVKELAAVNDEIASKARELSSLFRQRSQLVFDHGIEDYGSDYAAADPFDFWDAFESAIALPHVAEWAYVAQQETTRFLNIARTQSRTKPCWSDILDQVAARSPRDVVPSDAGDVAVFMSRTKATEWSRWGHRLLGTLDDWRGTFPIGFLRSCLTYRQLATLLEIALDAPENAYNDEQLRKLVRAYDVRRAAIEPDDSQR